MKLITLLIGLFLILPVNAIYGGESKQILWFDKCSSLVIDVQGEKSIDTNEYWFENCILIDTNRWSCDCYDGYELIIKTDIRTINTYNITVTYEYKVESYNSDSSSSSNNNNQHNYINFKPIEENKTSIRECASGYKLNDRLDCILIEETKKTEDNVSEVVYEQPKETKNIKDYIILIITMLVIIAIIGYLLFRKKKPIEKENVI